MKAEFKFDTGNQLDLSLFNALSQLIGPLTDKFSKEPEEGKTTNLTLVNPAGDETPKEEALSEEKDETPPATTKKRGRKKAAARKAKAVKEVEETKTEDDTVGELERGASLDEACLWIKLVLEKKQYDKLTGNAMGTFFQNMAKTYDRDTVRTCCGSVGVTTTKFAEMSTDNRAACCDALLTYHEEHGGPGEGDDDSDY